jgi:hypothetical protein
MRLPINSAPIPPQLIAEGRNSVYDVETHPMETGEFLTRILIWIALGGYFLGAGALLYSRLVSDTEKALRIARITWTAGCVSLWMHVASAFHFFHAWSHGNAEIETARQTAEVVGLAWGGGLYINYMIMLAWTADVIWWRCSPRSWRSRPKAIGAIWHGTLWFIIFNAMVVFKTGPLRWIGLGLSLALGLAWLFIVLIKARAVSTDATPVGTKG